MRATSLFQRAGVLVSKSFQFLSFFLRLRYNLPSCTYVHSSMRKTHKYPILYSTYQGSLVLYGMPITSLHLKLLFKSQIMPIKKHFCQVCTVYETFSCQLTLCVVVNGNMSTVTSCAL